MQKFLVSPTSIDVIEAFGTGGLFKSEEGKYFSYMAEFEQDEFCRITDSIGRVMPIDVTEFSDMARFFSAISEFQKARSMFDEINNDTLLDALNLLD